MNQDLTTVHPYDQKMVKEYITARGTSTPRARPRLHPCEGETMPKYTGPKPPYEYLQGLEKYTWMKAPRYEGKPMQVGPLARMLVAYAAKHEDVRPLVNEVLARLKVRPAGAVLDPGPDRGPRDGDGADRPPDGQVVRRAGGADQERRHQDLHRAQAGSRRPGRRRRRATATSTRPAGALGHWVQIENGKITRYQCVVPSTWNCSPA